MRLLAPLKADEPVDLVLGVNVLDEVPTDEYGMAKWEILFTKSDGGRYTSTLTALHNGTQLVDADDGDYSEFGLVVTSNNLKNQVSPAVMFNGAGDEQVMQLIVTCSTLWWKAHIWRVPMVGSGLAPGA